EAVFDEIFDADMLALLERLDLSQMSVAKDQGGFFELGAVWLVVDREGGRPRLMTVNRRALGEARDAAAAPAGRNQR
ncbi:MAG TPA: hypothetical protein DD436_05620, partial [Erythrobacter sp.]|nr:hypothetical protein [Erythrobacter sp.]